MEAMIQSVTNYEHLRHIILK